MAISRDLLNLTADYVRQSLSKDCSGHDWWHIDRVCRTAVQIAAEERADPGIVELAALLHDIADWKFHGGDESIGPQVARDWLTLNEVDDGTIEAVCQIISQISFKGAAVATEMSSIEGKCVQDADRLDAIGAIGIARAFAYGGHAGRAIHDPTVPANLHESFEEYKSSRSPTINHFYEKLLLLKDRMQTRTGQRLALRRHQFMEVFLKQFFVEWDSSISTAGKPAQ